MARRSSTELAFTALVIEGGLLAPDFLNRIPPRSRRAVRGRLRHSARPQAARRDRQLLEDRPEPLAGFRRPPRPQRPRHPWLTSRDFLEPFCRQVLGFADLRRVGQVAVGERSFPIGCAAGEGRVPLVFAAHDQPLDKPGSRHGDGTRRRSPFLLAQEVLNASHASLWAVVSNGLKLRVLRDNASLTRPAYLEADLEAIFSEGLYPDFAALWLLAHASRFLPSPPGLIVAHN